MTSASMDGKLAVRSTKRRGGAASGLPGFDEIVRFLEGGRAFGLDAPVRRIDTHAASVFLSGQRAWKLKRPVKLGYLDFSTAAKRRAALEAELRLNRRTAPDLYLAVHAITCAPDGTLGIDGEDVIVDWLLEMRRFPDGALLDDHARGAGLAEPLILDLAACIHSFHASAEVVEDHCAAARLRHVIDGNAKRFAALDRHLDPTLAKALLLQQRARLETLAPLLDSRGGSGRVRHCHGDLHLANIALIDGAPMPFDCLEFSDELATTDVLYDLAFLAMDLWHRDLRSEANLLLNRYLDLSSEDEEGIALFPLFLSVRAAVRAHVCAERADRTGRLEDSALAHDYLTLARRVLDPQAPRLIAIGGRSGTGKSMLARAIAHEIGAAPGARVIRTDVLRKRRAGVKLEVRLSRNQYTAEASRQIYRDLVDAASRTLGCGASAIADAAFLIADERRQIAATAAGIGVPFTGIWLEAGEAIRRERVASRTGDVSDADAVVVRLQSRCPVGPLGDWRRIRASGPPDAVAAAVRRSLRHGSAQTTA